MGARAAKGQKWRIHESKGMGCHARRALLLLAAAFCAAWLGMAFPVMARADGMGIPSGAYSLRSMLETDHVIGVASGAPSLEDWGGAASQMFTLERMDVGGRRGYRIVSAATGKALQAAHIGDGASIALAERSDDPRQSWYVKYMDNGGVQLLCRAAPRYAVTDVGGSGDVGAALLLKDNHSRSAQKWALAAGAIREAAIQPGGQAVAVRAEMSRWLPNDDGRLWLYAVPSYCCCPSSGFAVGSVKMRAGQREFSVPLGKGTGRSLLQRKLVLVRRYMGRLCPVSNGFFVTNPEAAAQNAAPFPEARTKKGLKLQLADSCIRMASELGVSHAVVDMPLEAFLYGGGHPYVYEGKAYEFGGGIDGYAQQIRRLNAAGIVVTGVFYLHDRQFRQYILPTAAKGGGFGNAIVYAMNTHVGRERVEALFSCLAEAFTSNGALVSNWVYGNESGQYLAYHYAGDIPYSRYHEALSDGFRLFNAAVKSVWANARTYVSLDHNWNVQHEVHGTYMGKRLLADFAADLSGEGAPHWDLAMHPYPSPEMDCRFWNRSAYVTDSWDTEQVTMLNAPMFAREALRRYGARVILSEVGLCAVDGGVSREAEQAAAVALAYYIAESSPEIGMVGFHREMDEAGSPWLLGLYRHDGLVFNAASARPAAGVFRDMDGARWREEAGPYAKIAGGGTWADVLAGLGLAFREPS